MLWSEVVQIRHEGVKLSPRALIMRHSLQTVDSGELLWWLWFGSAAVWLTWLSPWDPAWRLVVFRHPNRLKRATHVVEWPCVEVAPPAQPPGISLLDVGLA